MNEEKFLAYEEVRQSGETNMFDVATVADLSGGELNKEDIIDIMHNYEKYSEQWGQ